MLPSWFFADTGALKIPKVYHYGSLSGGVPGGKGKQTPPPPLATLFSRCCACCASSSPTRPPLPPPSPPLSLTGGLRGSSSFIIMEYLKFSGRPSPSDLGRQLAQMHLATPKDPNAAAGKFGFAVDNTCGGTPQPNQWQDDWVTFFREQRLRHQLQLTGNSELMKMGDKLCDKLHTYFEGIEVTETLCAPFL